MAGFLELSFELGDLGPEAAEEACFACGASAVTFMDGADDPVLEPLPGEVRLWRTTQLRALFNEDADAAALTHALAGALGLAPALLKMRPVADRAWEREWLRDFRPMQAHRLRVALGHDQGCALALLGADRSEDVDRTRPLIVRGAGPGASSGPAARDLVLLAHPRLVLPP